MQLISRHKNWHFKVSIINLDPGLSRKIEGGCPSPQERLETIKNLSEVGIDVTLRLRPFVLGMSNIDYLELIRQARKNGADSVSTEFFCLESRADKRLLERYSKMSKAMDFDILSFYRKNSYAKSGYLRLNYGFKKPYMERMENLCQELGMRFYVSDAHHKEKCANGSCCGLKESFNYSRGQFTEALMIAKKKGEVRLSEVIKNAGHLKGIRYCGAAGLNTSGTRKRVTFDKFTLLGYMRSKWNNPKDLNSPYRYFFGAVKPTGKDENGDLIYKYNR